MSQQPIEASTSWGGRAETLRRTGMAVLAAVSFATIVPALANAAGADLPNPVFIALQSAGSALAGDDPCETPEATPTELPSTAPSEAPSDAPSDLPTDAPSAAPSDVPSEAPSTAPSELPADCEEDGDGTTEASASASPAASASATETEAEVDAEGGEHGAIVSTVAKCAPRGKDPLFETLGEELRHHGSFVKAAAHGDTLTTPWGAFDLSTQAGADALCAAVELARADLASASPAAEDEKSGKGKGQGRDKDRKAKKSPKPDAADEG